MTAQAYFSLVTAAGRIKLAQSAAGGDPVVITHLAVGDGNGAETSPTAAATALVREVWAIVAISDAVLAHVDPCFAAEAELVAAIEAGTITTIEQVDAFPWPA